LPTGVLAYTKIHGEDRVTWQPKKDLRFALTVKKIEGTNPGFVAAGRSLREVEKRETQLLENVALGWIATLIAVFASLVILKKKFPFTEI